MVKNDGSIDESVADFIDEDEDIYSINGFSFSIATIDYNMFPKGTTNTNMFYTYTLNYNNN
nr:MAG TPA: hypothetical protein [Bacteriophage sp.]